MCMLYPLITHSSNLSLSNKILLYKQVLRPIMCYGSLVWGTAARTNFKKLQVQQNKFIRIACGAPRTTNMTFLQEELRIEPFADFIRKYNTEKLLKAQKHTNSLVTDALNYVPVIKYLRRRPKTILLPPPVP